MLSAAPIEVTGVLSMDAATPAGRVVMFVLNDCRHDARVLREAGTLARAGYRVTIVARTVAPYAAAGETEQRDGFEIRRVPVAAGLARWILLGRQPAALVRSLRSSAGIALRGGPGGWARLALAVLVGIPVAAVLALPAAMLLVVLAILRRAGRIPRLRPVWLWLEWRLQWRLGVLLWTRQAIAAAPAAEVAHAHDLRALPAAVAVARRDGATLVYDSHEVFTEAGANAERPAAARAAMLRLERGLTSGVDALVTVNDDVAAVLDQRLGLGERTVVVRNTLPAADLVPTSRALLREACGVADGEALLLCHGTFVAHRGFEQVTAALATPALAAVHAAFLGMGPLRGKLERLAADPALGGRLHVLDAVPPDELPGWIVGADVAVIPIQPSTLNHRLSSPNKLFEALAAGVPVVASDFPTMRRIVLDDPDGPLGEVCDPTEPTSIAAAVRRLLDLPPDEMVRWRERCRGAARARHSWAIDGARLLDLYGRLMGRRRAAGGAGGSGGDPAGNGSGT